MKLFKLLLIIFIIDLSACTTLPADKNSAAVASENSGISSLGKGDIDEVIELHQRVVMQDLKALMIKLYYRNPNGRHDSKLRTIEESAERVFSHSNDGYFPQWQSMTATDIVRIALDETYQGSDRILPFIVGLRKMIMSSYDNHTEFFYLTSIDEQKLYNSARNIEIAAWMLAEKRDVKGNLLILSDSVENEQRNLSYQRLIGQMIATQDNLAMIIANKNGRLVKTVVVRAASMMFLPI